MKIYFKGLDEFKRDLKRAGDSAREVAEKALDIAALKVKSESQRAITEKKTTYLGHLQNSISIVKSRLKREIGPNLIYAEIIHEGKRGGRQPPSEPLERWARIKLGQSGLGFVIARAIKKRGGIVRVNPFMKKGLEKAEGEVFKIFDSAHQAILQIIAGK